MTAQPNPTVTELRELATPEELDALLSGSLVASFDPDTDKHPLVFLRYGQSWTDMVEAWRGSMNLNSDMLLRPGRKVLLLWGAVTGGGRRVWTGSDLDALPYGSLVRSVHPKANPHWPDLLRRVHGGFLGMNPDQDDSLIPTGTAVHYYGELTVIWDPAAAGDAS